MVTQAIVRTTTAVTLGNGTIVQAPPAQSVTVSLGSSIASEAAWLYRAGWPLYALVDKYATNAPLDEETNCLATAVYFEARGESLDGQLAVARVVMNRAASGKYPPSWCATIKQPCAVLLRPPRPVPGGRHQFRRVAQGRGDRPPGRRQYRAERLDRRPLVPCRLCRTVVAAAT